MAALSNSRLFTIVSLMMIVVPVALEPGRARLATWPVFSGSAWLAKTMGIVDVARFAAPVYREVGATMTSTLSLMRSSTQFSQRRRLAGRDSGPFSEALNVTVPGAH
jgi:hypothetical protein